MRSRSLALAVLAAVALPWAASAQTRGHGGRTGSGGVHPRTDGGAQPAPVQPSIGLSLPEIVPMLPPIGLPAVSSHPPFVARPPHASQPIYRGGRRVGGYGNSYYPLGGVGYVLPAYGYGWGYSAAEQDSRPAPEPLEYVQPPAAYGTLRVEVLAATSAQVYVDGYYVGTADQAAAGLDLELGPHRVEVRARGYEPLTFDVRITPNQVITFREAMKTAANAVDPAPVPKPPAPATFYVIPGCYVGNVPPAAAKLPEGCDAARVQTFKQ